MPVTFKKPHLSIEEMDKAILKEAAGCSIDDVAAKTYTYTYEGCTLFLGALAKKLLGIYGMAIGNDPRRAAQLGFSNERDFAGERERLLKDTTIAPDRKSADLERFAAEERFANKLQNEFDPEAWHAVIELFNELYRRAQALERAQLVRMNVDHLVPEAVAQREAEQYGGDGKIPCDGTVEITERGLRCVSGQKWPSRKPGHKQRPGAQLIDYDVEVVA